MITYYGAEFFPDLKTTVMVLGFPELPIVDLGGLLRSCGPMREGSAKFLFRQVVLGIRHCHGRGVSHGDLKPGNVLVEVKTGRAILIDFGAAVKKRSCWTWGYGG